MEIGPYLDEYLWTIAAMVVVVHVWWALGEDFADALAMFVSGAGICLVAWIALPATIAWVVVHNAA
jgi:hypothetical protein